MSLYPTTRGFSFVVFEGPLAPVDWGTVERRGRTKNKDCLVRIERLLDRYPPDALVLQDMSVEGSFRVARIRALNGMIVASAETRAIRITAFSRVQVRALFSIDGQTTKQHIAETIGRHIPMLAPLVPPPRKPWNTEHPRMGIFDATGLIFAFYRAQQLAEGHGPVNTQLADMSADQNDVCS